MYVPGFTFDSVYVPSEAVVAVYPPVFVDTVAPDIPDPPDVLTLPLIFPGVVKVKFCDAVDPEETVTDA